MNINGNWINFAYMDNPTLYGSGNAIQHLHYLPFGEDWVDQRHSSWNAPYTFSGKEKDAETGYGYFGARYYDSGLSIWLSVDPMSDKYPIMSQYNYCANNPVMLVDPDGRIIVDPRIKDINKTFYNFMVNDFQNFVLQSPLIMEALQLFGGMTREQIVEATTDGKGPYLSFNGGMAPEYDQGCIMISHSYLDQIKALNDRKATKVEKQIALFYIVHIVIHELAHHGDYVNGRKKNQTLDCEFIYENGKPTKRWKDQRGNCSDRGGLLESMIWFNSDWGLSINNLDEAREVVNRFVGTPDEINLPKVPEYK